MTACRHTVTTSAGAWSDRCLNCGAIGMRVGFGGARTVWPDANGNTVREEGVDRCPCGCKYWEDDRCVDCGGTEVVEPDD